MDERYFILPRGILQDATRNGDGGRGAETSFSVIDDENGPASGYAIFSLVLSLGRKSGRTRHVIMKITQDEVKLAEDQDVRNSIQLRISSEILQAEAVDESLNGDGREAIDHLQTSQGDAYDRRISLPSNDAAAEDESRKARDGQSLEDGVRALITSQMRGNFYPVEGGLMESLRQCLRSDNRVSATALSGYIDHFQTWSEDAGWGCGWRNIQMLCSFLVSEVPEARDVLFNGVGFVPDIPSLQRWLEIAWQKGFDQSGAAYYNWKIYGTRKWIGTTECAALLRAFGVRIMIVSFTAMEGQESDLDGAGNIHRTTGSGAVKDNKRTGNKRATSSQGTQSCGIKCDECGLCVAPGYSYSGLVNDLCSDCMTKRKKRESAGPGENRGSNTEHSFEGYSLKPKYVGEKCAAVDNASGKDRADGVTYASPHGVQSMNNIFRGTQDKSMLITGKDSGANFCQLAIESIDHRPLIEWVWNYFMGESLNEISSRFRHQQEPIIRSDRSPLYFQHRGHSRTIVGIEKRRGIPGEVFLLVIDPSQLLEAATTKRPGDQFITAAADGFIGTVLLTFSRPFTSARSGQASSLVLVLALMESIKKVKRTDFLAKTLREKGGWRKLVEQDLHTLKHLEYKICYADRGIASGEELEELKVLTSLNCTHYRVR